MKFSLKFVTYHGCGSCYVDGTNLIQSIADYVFFQHMSHFGKIQKILQTKLQDQQEII